MDSIIDLFGSGLAEERVAVWGEEEEQPSESESESESVSLSSLMESELQLLVGEPWPSLHPTERYIMVAWQVVDSSAQVVETSDEIVSNSRSFKKERIFVRCCAD
tara:strand:+ start:417 stop:731 length:315 start_codon:yes stop_codon:yes gene_type:complete